VNYFQLPLTIVTTELERQNLKGACYFHGCIGFCKTLLYVPVYVSMYVCIIEYLSTSSSGYDNPGNKEMKFPSLHFLEKPHFPGKRNLELIT
jgi:hypothetical protein